jgi:hypothetical protein
MATLIDRDKCQERIFHFADRLVDWGFPKEAEAVRAVAKGIKLEKTVDAVEVVRCKDCKHYSKDGIWCDMNSKDRNEWFNWYEDDFCSYGERRTDG